MLERSKQTGTLLSKSNISGKVRTASGGATNELADHNYGEASDNSEAENAADQKRKKLKTGK